MSGYANDETKLIGNIDYVNSKPQAVIKIFKAPYNAMTSKDNFFKK